MTYSDKAKQANLACPTEKTERAYARIVAQNGREFYIKEGSKLEIMIGREKKADDLNYFNLSDQNTLSKQHATIFWNPDEQGFFIRNLSKNKVRQTIFPISFVDLFRFKSRTLT